MCKPCRADTQAAIPPATRSARRKTTKKKKTKERATQTVNVGAGVGGVEVDGLFGRHVIGRALHHAGAGQHSQEFRVALSFGPDVAAAPEPRSRIFTVPAGGAPWVRRPQQVARLDVAVNQSLSCAMLESERGLPDVIARGADGQLAVALDQPLQVRAVHVTPSPAPARCPMGPGVVGVDRCSGCASGWRLRSHGRSGRRLPDRQSAPCGPLSRRQCDSSPGAWP